MNKVVRNMSTSNKLLLRYVKYNLSFQRWSSVRVRFAPSPTGYLHLGGLRTALYNFLFASSQKGQFILRIEDTDKERRVAGAAEALEQELEWAGLVPHEGPAAGGPYGPYVQSHTLHLYREAAEWLVGAGHAYRCFCSAQQLQGARRAARAHQLLPRYDNRCAALDAAAVQRHLRHNTPYCIRFKLGEVGGWQDLVAGRVQLDVRASEGDPVLLKSDGAPTYHLASVVDDRRMRVSHVLRGHEWLTSTTKHIMIHRALGGVEPAYGHLPLILNADGTKLSKRHGHATLHHYRAQGVGPAALVNWLCSAGGGFPPREPTQPLRLHSLRELADMFQLRLVSGGGCRLEPHVLQELCRLELLQRVQQAQGQEGQGQQGQGQEAPEERLRRLVAARYPGLTPPSAPAARRLLHYALATSRAWRVEDLLEEQFAWLWRAPTSAPGAPPTPAPAPPLPPALRRALADLLPLLEQCEQGEADVEGERDRVEAWVRQVRGAVGGGGGGGGGAVLRYVRVVLTGAARGPPLPDVLALLRPARAARTLRRALHHHHHHTTTTTTTSNPSLDDAQIKDSLS